MELYILLSLFAVVTALFFRLELTHKAVIFALQESVSSLNKHEVEIPTDLVTEVKTELVSTVEDLIGQMRVPTAIDHLAGVAANIMQMREQWKIQKEASQMDGLISAPPVVDQHGSP
jgi:hypothetical protein